MDANTFDATLTAFRRRVPYKPFTVVLVNGDRVGVTSPDAFVARDGAAVYLRPGGGIVIFDHEGVSQVLEGLLDQPEA